MPKRKPTAKITTFEEAGIDSTPAEELSDKSKDAFFETEDVYDEEQRLEQMREDELAPEEAGFMEGYTNHRRVENSVRSELQKKKTNRKRSSI